MDKLPQHIAFIMDGNGRWAQRRNLAKKEGHKKGAEAMRKIVSACFKKGIYAVTVFALSCENFNRPKQELQDLYDLVRSFLKSERNYTLEHDIKLQILGDSTVFPQDLQELIAKAVTETQACKTNVLSIALNYGGQQEIIRAASLLAQSAIKNPTPQVFERFLYTAQLPPLDLLVRPGGEVRLSNFLLFQAAYAELYFSDVLWPDFGKRELDRALEAYARRIRKFGLR